MLESIKATFHDFVAGFNRWELWTRLGSNEILGRYRRSAIGPIWAILSFSIFTVSLGFLYSGLFNQELAVYLPHLILGMLVWNFISNVTVESCMLFRTMKAYIGEVNLPLTTYVFLLVWKNLFMFCFSMIVFAMAAVIIPLEPSPLWIVSIVGIFVTVVNALWIATVLAVVSARFHDLVEVVGTVLRIVFFLTPIIWMPGMSDRFEIGILMKINPFYHFIEISRAYLMGTTATLLSWAVVGAITVVGWLLAAFVYYRFRYRVPYWV